MHFDPVNSITLAKKRWNGAQSALFILGFLLLAGVFHRLPADHSVLLFGILLIVCFGSYMGLRIVSVFVGLFRSSILKPTDVQVSQISDESLPIYTVLLPVYREGEILSRLIQVMGELDYPKDKLDVKLLLESEDVETRAHLKNIEIPHWLEVVDVPVGFPKTKPRACNYGLARARGEFVVIFDTEDRPERDQLKKVCVEFSKLEKKTVCLQAQLNCFNTEENMLTRLFTLEYTAWFDLYLPGLYSIGSPIPLGGTSNHFRTDALKELGGWDPYNVTEDCDLGVRIARKKLVTRIIRSTTWEEAPSRLKDWITQRTRWLKGYFQTFLVHTQNPMTAIKEFGFIKFIYFNVVVGGQVGTLILAPIAWIVALAWIWYRWPIMDPARPWTYLLFLCTVVLSLFSIVFIGIHWVASHLRGRKLLGLWSLLFPIYWLLMSFATWRGVFQFFTDPFRWEKTPHGISGLNAITPDRGSQKTPRVLWQAVLLVSFIGAVFILSWPVSKFIERMAQRYCFSNVVYEDSNTRCRIPLGESWINKQKLKITVRLPYEEYYNRKNARLDLSLEVNNGEIFNRVAEVPIGFGREVVAEVPLDEGWSSPDADFSFGPRELMRVKFISVGLDQKLPKTSRFDVREIETEGKEFQKSNTIQFEKAPSFVLQNSMFQVEFQLEKFYENPFDPEQIDLWLNIKTPQGIVERVPAFWNQEFRKGQPKAGKEKLIAIAPANWSARYTPETVGNYSWWIEGQDSAQLKFATSPQELKVTESQSVGTVIREGNYFMTSHIQKNGEIKKEFLYPVGINLAWPRDARNIENWDFKLPDTESGSEVLAGYIDQMSRAGVNLARIWMAPWWGGLEWNETWPDYNGIGFYSLKNAWRIDQIFQAAEAKQVWINLMLDPHGPFTEVWDTQWDANPYNFLNGGFLIKGRHILSNDRAKKLFKNRYRYLVARYGSRPALFAWTIFNEGNTLTRDVELSSQWHAEMIDTMKALTPRKTLFSTSQILASGITFSPKIWEIPQLDFMQVSGYDFGKGMIKTLVEKETLLSSVKKPAMIDEFGGGPFGGSMDFIAEQIHDGLWASWMSRWASAPLSWWWTFIIEKGLLTYYLQFNDFIRGENLQNDNWKFEKKQLTDQLHAMIRLGTHTAYVWVYSPVASNRQDDSKVKPAFKPMSTDPGSRFGTARDVVLSFQGLEKGNYRVEFWDSWGRGLMKTTSVHTTENNFTVKLPEINRDIALKIKKARP